jgi:hypothetical protein
MPSDNTWWLPADRETHTDSDRCGFCGHSASYHAHVNGKGLHGGKCSVTSMTGDPCPCKSCVKVRHGKRVP